MLEPVKQIFFESVDEIFESDLKIMQSFKTHQIYEDNPKYQNVLKSNRIHEINAKNEFLTRHAAKEMKFVMYTDCYERQMVVEIWGDGKSFNGYYLVKDPVSTARVNLIVDPTNPYMQKFQGYF